MGITELNAKAKEMVAARTWRNTGENPGVCCETVLK
jgi:hypothetical protein